MSRFIAFVLVLLAGCASQSPAPVIERAAPLAPPAEVRAGTYTVKKGDTLFRIALEHGQDYKDLIAWNRLDNPDRLEVGQILRVAPPEGSGPAAVAIVKPVQSPAIVEVKPAGVAPTPAKPAPAASTEKFKVAPKGGKLAYSEENLARLRAADGGSTVAPPPPSEKPADPSPTVAAGQGADERIEWAWPATGRVIAGFSEGGAQTNKGLDIAGKTGDPVLAAAAGKVVYVGNGLRGYGNLVIVRHNATFLSAYAHNNRILVKEGASVTRGQKIAEVGNTDADLPKLHFEIRQQGKPVDPLKHLPPK